MNSPFVFYMLFAAGIVSGSQQREIPVRILADEEFRALPAWKEKAEEALGSASASFEKHFGVKMKTTSVSPWISEGARRSLDELAEDLDSTIKKEIPEIVVAFTAQDLSDKDFYGYSLFREGIIIVRDMAGVPELSRLLKHELGHLFGAVHVNDPESVMDVRAEGENFDEVNAGIIRLNRERDFNPLVFPIAPENLDDALRLYREAARKNSAVSVGARGRREGWNAAVLKRIWSRLDDAHLLLAQTHIELREYEEAIENCRAARRLNSENIETLNLMGIALRRKGDFDGAVACYREILKRRPDHARVHYNLGIALSKRGETLSALESYSRAVRLKPNFAEAYCNMGDALLRMNRVDEAAENLLKAIDLNSGFSLAYSNLAEVHCRRKDYDKALEAAEKAASLDPALSEARNMKGKALKALGRHERAEGEFKEAVRLDPANEKALYNLAGLFLEKGQTAEARRHYERALAVRENFAEAHAGLGACHIREGRYDDALRSLGRSLELGGESAATRLNLSTAFLKKGMAGAAASEAERALELDPGLAQARNNLGIALLLQSKPDEAELQFRLALASDQVNKEALANLANLVFSLGRNLEAIEIFLRAVGADPANASLHNNLAVAYFHVGEYGLARKHARKAQDLGLRLHPEFLKELEKKLRD